MQGIALHTAVAGRPAAGTLAGACLAIVVPTLIGFSLPPTATFLNQVAAWVGWGVFILVLAESGGVGLSLPWRGSERTLVAALALLAIAAGVAPLWAGHPATLALSAVLAIAAAALVAMAGAAVARAGQAPAAMDALAAALLAAGAIGAALGVLQVYFPQWTDGDIIAAVSNGRAAGNLRQPNHLSSLLLWSLIALVWLAERGRVVRRTALAAALLLLAGLVLTGSRTGMLGVLVLAVWGALEPRLSRRSRAALLASPIVFALLWVGLGALAEQSHHAFGGSAQIGKGDISSSRFAIWSNTLALIASRPWLGVGWGEFNFAWTLTPFPDRPVAFFDHTHNLPLQFAVELGLPLAALVLALLARALWLAWRSARRGEDAALALRAAFMMVLTMVVHSQFEYPLWYSYFLLPTAFAFGLCLGAGGRAGAGSAWALRAGAGLMIVAALAALADYQRVVVIYSPGRGALSLDERIAAGKRSWLFGHHADYAEVTTSETPVPDPRQAFARTPHHLLDTRLMIAWVRSLAAAGQTDAARHVAARLKEFRSPDARQFFEPCEGQAEAGRGAVQCQSASAPVGLAALRR